MRCLGARGGVAGHQGGDGRVLEYVIREAGDHFGGGGGGGDGAVRLVKDRIKSGCEMFGIYNEVKMEKLSIKYYERVCSGPESILSNLNTTDIFCMEVKSGFVRTLRGKTSQNKNHISGRSDIRLIY